MASEHEWRDCFHPTTQQGGDGCHFFMRCHGIWPERCDLSERDHRESDAEKIERLMGSDGSIGLVGPLQATRMLMNGRAVLVRTEQWERQFRPVDSYACQECGRSDGLDAVVPDGVWAEISHGQNLLCLWCIDRRCEEAGIGVAATLHFMGRAITGTSQSDADADHNARLTALLAERDAEIARLLDATAKMEEALFEIRDYCAEVHDGDTLERLAYRVVGMANGAINDYYAALAGGEVRDGK